MAKPAKQAISALLDTHQADVLQAWLQRLKAEGALQSGRIREGELQAQCSEFLTRLRGALSGGASNVDGPEFAGVRELLGEMSAARATQGFSPRETAMFVFSLKQPLFEVSQRHDGADAAAIAAGQLVDRRCCSTSSACYTTEAFQKTREE